MEGSKSPRNASKHISGPVVFLSPNSGHRFTPKLISEYECAHWTEAELHPNADPWLNDFEPLEKDETVTSIMMTTKITSLVPRDWVIRIEIAGCILYPHLEKSRLPTIRPNHEANAEIEAGLQRKPHRQSTSPAHRTRK